MAGGELFTRTLAAASAAALIAACGPALAQEAPPPLPLDPSMRWEPGYAAPIAETFLVERAELSADGTRIAYVAALGNTRRLRVEALDGSLVRMADLQDAPLRDIMWAGNDRVLLLMSFDRLDFVPEDNGLFAGLAYNVANNSWEQLLYNHVETAKNWLGMGRRIERSEAVFPMLFERPIVRLQGGRPRIFLDAVERGDGDRGAVCRYNLYETDVDVGWTRRVGIGVTRSQGRVVGPDNVLKAMVREGRLRLARGPGWREVDVGDGAEVRLLGLGHTADTILIRTGEGAAARTWELPLEGEPVLTPLVVEELTAPEPIYDDGGMLIGFEGRRDDGDLGYRFLDPRLTAVWGGIVAAFPGDGVRLASWSADYSKLLVYAEREGSSDYHLIDVAAGTSVFLAPSYPEPDQPQLDRTGNLAAQTIRRAADARIDNLRDLCWPPA